MYTRSATLSLSFVVPHLTLLRLFPAQCCAVRCNNACRQIVVPGHISKSLNCSRSLLTLLCIQQLDSQLLQFEVSKEGLVRIIDAVTLAEFSLWAKNARRGFPLVSGDHYLISATSRTILFALFRCYESAFSCTRYASVCSCTNCTLVALAVANSVASYYRVDTWSLARRGENVRL
jgi:hypothetical protein